MEHEIIHQEREIADLKASMTGMQEQIKTLFSHVEQQNKLIDTVNNLALAQQKVVDAQGQILKTVDALQDDMASIKAQPAKRWNGLVEKIIVAAVGILVGAFFAALGIK